MVIDTSIVYEKIMHIALRVIFMAIKFALFGYAIFV